MNEAEAVQVRALFRLYDELGNLGRVEEAAMEQGITSKPRVTRTGQKAGGLPLTRGQIHHMLTNVTYRGLTKHKEEAFPGMHSAIVDQDLWERVQAKMQEASARPRGRRGRLAAQVGGDAVESRGNGTSTGHLSSRKETSSRAPGQGQTAPALRDQAAAPAPLTGKLRDETGDRLTPTHSVKAGRRIRYYASHRLITGPADRTAWRLPAPALEEVVARVVAEHLEHAAEGYALLAEPDAQCAEALRRAAGSLTSELRDQSRRDDLLRHLIASGQIGPGQIRLTLDGGALANALMVPAEALCPSLLTIEAPLQMRRRGVELRLVAGTALPVPDATILRTLARAQAWAAAIRKGGPIAAIGRRENRSETFIRSRVDLAFLAPRVQEAILAGTQPVDLTLERLIRTPLPLSWAEQERVLGFQAQG